MTTQQQNHEYAMQSLTMKVKPIDDSFTEQIKMIIDQKTKPVGSLGQLEDIALQLALIHSNNSQKITTKIPLNKPTVVVFAGDHGINEENVSIAPSAVTRQMVLNFIAGGAAINCFCQSNNLAFKVVDTGILEAIRQDNTDQEITCLVEQRLGNGTNNFAKQAAMSMAQVHQGIAQGQNLIHSIIEAGSQLIILGEMGIANTSSASAILAALTSLPVPECVGKGTGISDEQLLRKTQLIESALARITSNSPLEILREVGGFEIVQMTGAIIAAANKGVPVLIDGFIVSTAALLAVRINKHVRDYLIFSHQSHEQGHQNLLNELAAKPLLNIGLRLGEGTGAALAYPLIKASAAFYNDMASFSDAGVTV